jgi:hypothetical protein
LVLVVLQVLMDRTASLELLLRWVVVVVVQLQVMVLLVVLVVVRLVVVTAAHAWVVLQQLL